MQGPLNDSRGPSRPEPCLYIYYVKAVLVELEVWKLLAVAPGFEKPERLQH